MKILTILFEVIFNKRVSIYFMKEHKTDNYGSN